MQKKNNNDKYNKEIESFKEELEKLTKAITYHRLEEPQSFEQLSISCIIEILGVMQKRAGTNAAFTLYINAGLNLVRLSGGGDETIRLLNESLKEGWKLHKQIYNTLIEEPRDDKA